MPKVPITEGGGSPTPSEQNNEDKDSTSDDEQNVADAADENEKENDSQSSSVDGYLAGSSSSPAQPDDDVVPNHQPGDAELLEEESERPAEELSLDEVTQTNQGSGENANNIGDEVAAGMDAINEEDGESSDGYLADDEDSDYDDAPDDVVPNHQPADAELLEENMETSNEEDDEESSDVANDEDSDDDTPVMRQNPNAGPGLEEELGGMIIGLVQDANGQVDLLVQFIDGFEAMPEL